MRVRILGYILIKNWRNENCITSLCILAYVIKVVGGVVLPSNAKRKFINFLSLRAIRYAFCLAPHACYSNRWKLFEIQ